MLFTSSFQISRIIVLESCITSPSIFTYGLILRRRRGVAFLSDMHFFFREIRCSCREIYALVLCISSFQISRNIVLERKGITSPSIFTYGPILRRGRPAVFLSEMHFFFREIGCSCREIRCISILNHHFIFLLLINYGVQSTYRLI